MRPIATKEKQVAAELDYLFDWSHWLVSGDTIASFVVTITGADSALINYLSVLSSPAMSVRVWLKLGTGGKTYSVKCAIVTTNATPRKDERALELKVTP